MYTISFLFEYYNYFDAGRIKVKKLILIKNTSTYFKKNVKNLIPSEKSLCSMKIKPQHAETPTHDAHQPS